MVRVDGARLVARRRFVVFLCIAVVVLDGYDLAIYGVVLPAMLAHHDWSMTPAQAGLIASAGLVGLLLGAPLAGYLCDRFGRRTSMVVSIALFSTFTALCAIAPGTVWFGVLRFLVGLTLGGILPIAVAMAVEFAPVARRNLYGGMTQGGYAIGAIAVALLGIVLIPLWGFRAMFVLGGALGLLMLPILWRLLPESADYLLAKGRRDEARRVADMYGLELDECRSLAGVDGRNDKAQALRGIVARDYRRRSLAFAR